jgi:hypothetical protein
MYATSLLPSLTGMIAFSASAGGTAVSQFAAPETTFATVSVSLLRCCVRPGSNQGLIEMLQATNSRVAGEPQDRFKRTAALRMSLKIASTIGVRDKNTSLGRADRAYLREL